VASAPVAWATALMSDGDDLDEILARVDVHDDEGELA
jgi:hypothetical protein